MWGIPYPKMEAFGNGSVDGEWPNDPKIAFIEPEPDKDGTCFKADCDEEGWSYVHKPQLFLVNNANLVWENPGVEFESTPKQKHEGSRITVSFPKEFFIADGGRDLIICTNQNPHNNI